MLLFAHFRLLTTPSRCIYFAFSFVSFVVLIHLSLHMLHILTSLTVVWLVGPILFELSYVHNPL